MITNERQYKITRAELETLKKLIENFDLTKSAEKFNSKELAKGELDSLKSECEILSSQVTEYEALKEGKVKAFRATSLNELPKILIQARIAKGLSQRELAEKLGVKEQQIQRYEAEEYTSASLNRLVEVSGVLELNINEVAEFNSKKANSDASHFIWSEFPIKEMYRRNWFDDFFTGTLQEAEDNVEEIISIFLDNCFDDPVKSAARQRSRVDSKVNKYALLAWQCRVISLAKKDKKKNKYKFQLKLLTKDWFENLARLSLDERGPVKAKTYLREAGISLVIEPHLSHTYLDGAAFLIPQGPIVAMTLRQNRIDNFWFVLFHELFHIAKHLHSGKIESIFDDLECDANDIEKEADQCAGETLIPQKRWEVSLARYIRSKETVIALANELKRAPEIVAGKIRNETKNFTILEDMVGQGKVKPLFPEVKFL